MGKMNTQKLSIEDVERLLIGLDDLKRLTLPLKQFTNELMKSLVKLDPDRAKTLGNLINADLNQSYWARQRASLNKMMAEALRDNCLIAPSNGNVY